ncbi:MAG: bis(5'-nucleosyl)-tetraphosphatase (symmetrical) YqeK [Candidatus Sumerlaeaceae bacterium]|nr:bis(5'-nucleosyl)-tetraphosphatase (symmetrical) YqeK [Candidatus Sumerlaeaceae bacterium]
MDSKRFLHSLGVVQTALVFAPLLEADIEKVCLAAHLHDCAKCMGRDRLLQIADESGCCEGTPDRDFPNILHAPVGAHIARKEFGVEDQEVLDAIRFHPTGCANPSRTLTVLMAADFCEPTRNFPGVEEARIAIRRDLVGGLSAALGKKVLHVEETGRPVHPRVYEMMESLKHA